MDYLFNIFSMPMLANLALAISVLSLLVSTILLLRLHRLNQKINREKDKLETRLRIYTSSAVGMGDKLLQLERRVEDFLHAQHKVAETEAQFSYTQALKLIERGVDQSVIMSNSGLSESEVNLMKLLHQAKEEERKLTQIDS